MARVAQNANVLRLGAKISCGQFGLVSFGGVVASGGPAHLRPITLILDAHQDAQLSTLPVEVLTLVFQYLSAQELLRLERVSKQSKQLFEAAAKAAYNIVYGPRPFHRALPHPVDYRLLVIEQLQYEIGRQEEARSSVYRGETWTPELGIKQLLDEHYLDSNQVLQEEAMMQLLRAGDERGSAACVEFVATSLMAQRRLDDAAQY